MIVWEHKGKMVIAASRSSKAAAIRAATNFAKSHRTDWRIWFYSHCTTGQNNVTAVHFERREING